MSQSSQPTQVEHRRPSLKVKQDFLADSDEPSSFAAKLLMMLRMTHGEKTPLNKVNSMLDQNSRLKQPPRISLNFTIHIEFDEAIPTSTKLPFVLDQDNKTNLFVYVDDRNGKAALLSAARKRGMCTHMVRSASEVPDDPNSFVYFFIDHLDYRDRDKEVAEGFASLSNIRLAPSIQELRVYDDKGAQQLEYAMMMPPALYSTQKGKMQRTT